MTHPIVSSPSAAERKVRIEVLRLQAAYERLALQQGLVDVAQGLQPGALVSTARAHLSAGASSWLGTGLGLMRRYPVVLSLVTSALSSPARRRIALKSVFIAGLVWLGLRERSRSHAAAGSSQPQDIP